MKVPSLSSLLLYSLELRVGRSQSSHLDQLSGRRLTWFPVKLHAISSTGHLFHCLHKGNKTYQPDQSNTSAGNTSCCKRNRPVSKKEIEKDRRESQSTIRLQGREGLLPLTELKKKKKNWMCTDVYNPGCGRIFIDILSHIFIDILSYDFKLLQSYSQRNGFFSEF